MTFETVRLGDVVLFNPRENIKKGVIAKKIDMSVLQPFTRDVPSYEFLEYKGGTKFRNGDTIMARITPCLENGKTAKVNVLEENEVGFGSTEYIVFRAIDGISDEDFVYYLVCSPIVREPAIKSMVGSSGRQRVQTDVLQNLEINLPDLETQRIIGSVLRSIDDRISLNTAINENLEQQAYLLLEQMLNSPHNRICALSDIAYINPRYTLSKGTEARYIDMSQLSTTTSFPDGWTFRPYNGGMKFKNKDTIMARITPCLENGKTAYIDFLEEDETAFGSTEYIVLSPKDNIPPELLYCIVRYPEFRTYATINMNGSSGRQRVSGEIIGKYEITSFSQEELSEFGTVAEPLFKQITENSLQNRNLSALRDTLLPKLMNGEIDVSAVEI